MNVHKSFSNKIAPIPDDYSENERNFQKPVFHETGITILLGKI
jgi:hypothetical protein